jgi:hemolysin activation/secretion protein
MQSQNRWNGVLAIALTVLPVVPALADVPTVPTPGSIGDTLKKPPELKAPAPAPSVTVPERAPPKAGSGGPTLVVKRFTFSGNTVYSERVLAAQVADFVDKPITIAQLHEAADRLSDFYNAHGYTLASVTVPPQKIVDGVVNLDIVEGHIAAIRFEGNHGYSAERLKRFMQHTQPGQPYFDDNLRQDLQALNDLPGLATRAVLKPGAEYGSSDVVVKAEERRVELSGLIDNYGRKEVGEYRYSAQAAIDNPLGYGDRMQIVGLHSNTGRLNYGDFGYAFPVGYSGLRFTADFGYAHFDVAPLTAGSPDTIAGKNENLNAAVSYPWLRNGTDRLETSAGYLYTHANADLTGLAITETNISLLNLGVSESHAWANAAVSQITGSLHTNFRTATDTDRNRERYRVEIDAQHLQPLWWGLQTLVQLDGVYSPDTLADTEQFGIGGPTSVRGFPPTEVRGDRGYFGQLTLRRPFALRSLVLIPRVFGDSGVVEAADAAPGTSPRDSLTSLGVGLDATYRAFSAKVDWAHPMDSKPVSDGKDDGRVYVAISASF